MTPLGRPRSLYHSYTTFTLSYSQESLEDAARGAGWSWGVMGVQPGAGATPDASIPAILVVGIAHVRMNPKICQSDAILERSWDPGVVACAHLLFALLLYLVVCVLCVCGAGIFSP